MMQHVSILYYMLQYCILQYFPVLSSTSLLVYPPLPYSLSPIIYLEDIPHE